MRFEGKTVLVTGASRGIGRGIADAFARAGARLVLVADDPEVLRAAEDFGAAGFVLDISDDSAVASALNDVLHIDVLINNAGLERLTPLDDPTAAAAELFSRIVAVNVTGTYLVTRAALPKMSAGGRIINTSSIWGRTGEPLFGAYVASKHAIIGLTKSWAKELGPRGITVNAVAPGWVKTEASLRSLAQMAARLEVSEERLMQGILAAQALPGLMEPKDVVGAYLFLASEYAANITGQTLGADRGEVPW
jgi:NAD(P)-dependent dehydrogenase (short-subunit alcohol dehydrogenase family)